MIKPPFELKTEYLSKPIGIDIERPRFSWIVDHPDRQQFQSAYRIIVSSKKSHSESEEGDLWDTEKILSQKTINIAYEGLPLKSNKTYYWRAKWWDNEDRESDFSDIEHFETALIQDSDWKAHWITAEAFTNRKTKRNYQTKGGINMYSSKMRLFCGVYLRNTFKLSKIPITAKSYICGLGHYELYINGKKIDNRILDPGWTDTNQIALYSSYDISSNLRRENAIGVVLGNGRHIENYGYDYPKLIFQLHVEYEDGSNEIIISNDTWKFSLGPIKENGIYLGEKYDARKEMPGWNEYKYDDSEWEKTTNVQGPKLISQLLPPIEVSKEINPKRLYTTDPGIYIYDFGQNFTGFVRLKVCGPRGAEIKIRYAELVDKTGNINTAPNRSAVATDIYILKGKGLERYQPHFTYHGFRYVEITGFPGVPTLQSVLGICFYTSVQKTGEFLCSNELINLIHKNTIWGQLSNYMSIPTDSPQRDERHGWMGDAALTIEEAIYNFNVARFYTKFLRDIKFAQKENGELSDVVPPYWPLYPADPAWGSAYITIAWHLYLYYKDKRVLEEHYDTMKKYVNFLHLNADNFIIRSLGRHGDWCSPGCTTSRKTPLEQVSTWYYLHDTLLFSKIAEVLNKKQDFQLLSERVENIKNAYNENYLSYIYQIPKLSPTDETFSQTSNILPLFLNLVPQKDVSGVFSALLLNIIEEHDCHIDTGIVGTRYLMDVLSKFEKNDVAYKLITQESYPSWGYMIKHGATTLWERWEKLEGPAMNSHNHIAFGTVDTWFYKNLAGIQLIESGWEKIKIRPYIPSNMKFAAAKLNTIKGILSSSWKKEGNLLEIFIGICLGVNAEVWLPMVKKETIIYESDKIIFKNGFTKEKVQGVEFITIKQNHIIFKLGSGYFRFRIIPFSTDKGS
ncbi:MAG: Bacterial alpha-L-rhamnosidase [Candidatus Lokiarchaeota archaeon]|nr:Bacterial alpha-L-rhamnosidase [Candidatus Lokiarchaeota archaeon]MBD3341978.1 Bacterial alpha-L-rhamnosidase [Candidatus Lokiarchaeota archaeon]